MTPVHRTILAIDTSAERCGVTLWRGRPGETGTVLADTVAEGTRLHAERLVPMAVEVLQAAGAGFDDVERFAVVVGPGSFTGIRIGLAAVAGWMLAAGRPAVGVSAFDVLAARVLGMPRLLAVDSRRSAPFLRFDSGAGIGRPFWAEPRAVVERIPSSRPGGPPPVTVAGTAADAVLEALARAGCPARAAADPAGLGWSIDGATVARLAASRTAPVSDDPPAPLYIRPPDAVPAGPARAIV